jgi:hypothetical protein
MVEDRFSTNLGFLTLLQETCVPYLLSVIAVVDAKILFMEILLSASRVIFESPQSIDPYGAVNSSKLWVRYDCCFSRLCNSNPLTVNSNMKSCVTLKFPQL